MNFHILTCSHQGLDWAQSGIAVYEKRIKRFAKISELPYKRNKLTSKGDLASIQKLDATAILNKIPNQSQVFLCDEKGKQPSSEEFASLISKSIIVAPNIVFIIGPAYGLPKTLLEQYPSIALSRLTFQHEVAQLLLYEQIYRALTIINNHPYHL